jgi:hypothetical protein
MVPGQPWAASINNVLPEIIARAKRLKFTRGAGKLGLGLALVGGGAHLLQRPAHSEPKK